MFQKCFIIKHPVKSLCKFKDETLFQHPTQILYVIIIIGNFIKMVLNVCRTGTVAQSLYMRKKVNLIFIQRVHEIMRCHELEDQFVCCTCLLRSPKTVTPERRRIVQNHCCTCREGHIYWLWIKIFIILVIVWKCLLPLYWREKAEYNRIRWIKRTYTYLCTYNRLLSIKSFAW